MFVVRIGIELLAYYRERSDRTKDVSGTHTKEDYPIPELMKRIDELDEKQMERLRDDNFIIGAADEPGSMYLEDYSVKGKY